MRENALIESARAGDPSAWEALVQAHHEPVFRFAYLMLNDRADADDVAQETFIRAYRSLGRFDVERRLRPWLLSIAANVAKNRLRSWGRYTAALGRWQQESSPPNVHMIDDFTAAQIEAGRLWEAVRRLRREDQTMIYLRYFLEMPVDETAESLGIAPGTVKSRLSRALGRLRELIERDFPDLAEPDGR